MKYLIALTLTVFAFSAAHGQWKEIIRFKSEHPVLSAFVDRPGDLYLVTTEPAILKFDPFGKRTAYSVTPSHPTVFDPRDGARPFVFFRELGYCGIMTPSLEEIPAKVHFSNTAFAISPYLVCSVGDHHFAILDSADWTIKKINPKAEMVMVDEPLPDSLHTKSKFVSMREYQNFIFLHDRNAGIRVFNGIGKLVRTIYAKDLTTFNFLGEELYYLHGAELRFFNLFTAESRTIKLNTPPDFAILTDQRLFTVTKDLIQIFEVTP